MRVTPIASPGPLGELFWLLSHPNCVTLSSIALGVALLAGERFETVWCQALALLIVSSALAQLTTQARSARLPLFMWLLGGLSLLIGVGTQIGASGLVTLPEGARVESYERGEGDVKVAHHIGATLSLKRLNNTANSAEGQLSFDLGGTQSHQISERALLSGEQFSLGSWSLSLDSLKRDPKSPRALVKLSPRAGGETQTLWLRSGDRLSPDGQLSVNTYDVAGNFSSPHIKNLGSAVDLELSWRAQGDGGIAGEILKERAWHFVDIPQLNQQAGVSPWVVNVERIEPSPVYQLRMTARASMSWIWLGLCFWIASLCVSVQRELSPSTI